MEGYFGSNCLMGRMRTPVSDVGPVVSWTDWTNQSWAYSALKLFRLFSAAVKRWGASVPSCPPSERTGSAPDHNNPYREALLCSSPRLLSVMGSNQVISRGSALVELWRGVPLRGSCVGPKKAQCYLTDCGKGGFRLDRLQNVSCKHSGETSLRARCGQTR